MPLRYPHKRQNIEVFTPTLYENIDRGVIKAVRIGNQRFIEKAELDRFMGVIPKERRGAAVYVRVSTHKQREAGNLERQKERLLNYCKENVDFPATSTV